MTDKNDDKQHKALMAALEKIQAPLEALALLKLADEFYTKEERANLYAEYKKLRDADMAAYERLGQTRTDKTDGDLSWEQRVKEYGEARAAEQLAPLHAAMDAKQATSRAVTAFEKEHRLVLRLLDTKSSWAKSRYE